MTKNLFRLESKFQPCGDQPEAIAQLVAKFQKGEKFANLLGVTGSGKTFTMANVIAELGKKTLILAHNKTLAAQLYGEFKEFFPHNAVEYFVSYYDYYQPEAYIPGTDTYIEKDSAINDEIDKLRHSATRSLLEREDVIVIASVSCIYGIGSPDEYASKRVTLFVDMTFERKEFIASLVSMQYVRNDIDFVRGSFRVRGDLIEVFPAYEDSRVIRLEFFDSILESISLVDPLRGKVLEKLSSATIYPKSHYVVSEEKMKTAIKTITEELRNRIQFFEKENKLLEKQRIEQRTLYDLEMMEEMGHCSGIENYSRHLTGSKEGEPPPTLIDFFKRDFLLIVDESHMTMPQVGGMYAGDRSRKSNLVEHGFRLPSALDNRPLNFTEFTERLDQTLFVSATPGDYELKLTEGEYVEQLIRPTGLVDPVVIVRDATNQVENLLEEIKITISKGERVFVTTLTKKLAEELSTYYQGLGIKVKYLHSDTPTLERIEILRDLRLGLFDVLVGINLLREGLDIPEVSLVAILDADKEGFLRSTRALIQTIGRAARNISGRAILYAYKETPSMKAAISETNRRREIQHTFNMEHQITPKTIIKEINGGVIDVLQGAKASHAKKKKGTTPMSLETIDKEIQSLKKEMQKASKELRFEDAADIRDRIKQLEFARLTI